MKPMDDQSGEGMPGEILVWPYSGRLGSPKPPLRAHNMGWWGIEPGPVAEGALPCEYARYVRADLPLPVDWPDDDTIERGAANLAAPCAPWHILSDDEKERFRGDARRVLIASTPPPEADQIGCAERAVGRWVYRRIEVLAGMEDGADFVGEHLYLSEIVADVEEYAATGEHPVGTPPPDGRVEKVTVGYGGIAADTPATFPPVGRIGTDNGEPGYIRSDSPPLSEGDC